MRRTEHVACIGKKIEANRKEREGKGIICKCEDNMEMDIKEILRGVVWCVCVCVCVSGMDYGGCG
jgi:hypothetical protein